MSASPFFSIVIPTFNRADIVPSTVEKILKQDFKDFEIIVVDDGSKDNTLALLQDRFSINPQVKLLHQSNKERGAARNNGFRNSAGTYVIFFDSDDHMHINHLTVLHTKIIKLNFPDFIATKFDFVNTSGKHYPSDMHTLKEGFYDYKLFLNGNPLACNICVRKKADGLFTFEEDREFAIMEDWMFLIQNTFRNKIYIIDIVTISMRDHIDRSMRSEHGIIEAKIFAAKEWIHKKIELTPSEKNRLDAHVNYFCAIHAYIDFNRRKSIRFAWKAIRKGGIKIRYVLMLLKSVAGRKIITALK